MRVLLGFGEAGIALEAGRGEGLRSQQPQHETANRGNFRVQRGQWLRVESMGETFFFWREMRSREGTGGAQQPLTVVGIGEGKKSERVSSAKGREPDTSWLRTVSTSEKAR